MDRTLCGLTAGMISGIVMNTWNLLDFYFLHITEIRFLDWAAVLITWSRPDSNFTTIFFLLVAILWDAFLGTLFAHLLTSMTSRGIFVKSTVFSLICWFTFKIIVNLFRVPFLSGQQPVLGSMSNVAAVILWGITLGFVLKKLNKQIQKQGV